MSMNEHMHVPVLQTSFTLRYNHTLFFHQGRAEFASYLKKHSNVERLLSHLFQLMPHKPGSASLNTSLSKSQSDASPLKRSLCEEEGEEDLGPESVKRSAASGGAEDSWFGSPTISFTAAGRFKC